MFLTSRKLLKIVCPCVVWGGVLYIATPANNHCGHGFYQFSPELFFSLLSPKNGFEILDMSYVEVNRKNGKLKRIRHLKDNTVERQRVEINTRWQTELFLVARRIGSLPKYIDVQQSEIGRASCRERV